MGYTETITSSLHCGVLRERYFIHPIPPPRPLRTRLGAFTVFSRMKIKSMDSARD